ncbi:ATP-dependent helicase [uncultured Jatrophihabitans sp.]|uniref:ATP-dependent helicase n=1 Tax=uncultured Jatrophihabitans sp. TaxID=1610747 RepID=UPI0035C9E45E
MTDPTYHLVRPPRAAATAPVLDDAQRRVVEHPGGPLLVLAGPGTGKTTTLVEAVIDRVTRRGVDVGEVLMLTFSRRAAGELRDRVAARLGRTIREPVARTLHSYAFGLLRMANLARGLPAPRLLAAAEQDIVVRDLLAATTVQWPPQLHPALATTAFAGEVRELLMRAVERGLDGAALHELGRRHRRADWQAAGAFLDEYHSVYAMKDPGAYDPAELIRSALNALHDDAELLARERAQRRRIFVDEYQDTDPAQAELLALVAAGADELVLVGDPDQSIYAFRGADESAIRDVETNFGPTPTVALTTCRRSGPQLLAASRRVAARLPGPSAQRALVPVNGAEPGRVEVGVFRSASEEAAYVAATLRRAHLDGLPWSRMAVLVRSTSLSLPTLRRAFSTAGVPVSVRGDDLPLADHPAVATLLDVVRAVLAHCAAQDSEELAERLLLGPIGSGDAVYLRRLRRALRQMTAATGDAPTLVAAVWDVPGAAILPQAVRRPMQAVAAVLAAGAATIDTGSPEDVLWSVWQASGLARRWEQASRAGGPAGAAADRDLDAIVELFDAAARFTDRLPQAGIARFTEHLAAQQLPGDPQPTRRLPSEHVQVLTAHASKGLEWDLVCVANVQEGVWPDLRRRGSLLGSEALVDIVAGRDPAVLSQLAPQLAEERRLFYVAVTRARQRVVVTAVSGDEDQPSRFLDELDPVDGDRPVQLAPRGVHLTGLVAELRAAVCDPATPADDARAAAEALAELADARVGGAEPAAWWGLAPLSDDRPVVAEDEPVVVSPSRIDAFLRCEVRALLTDLGAKDDDQVSASLGILVHAVAAEAPPGADLAEYERRIDEQWSTLEFGARWFASNERRRATEMLSRLVDWLARSRNGLALAGVEEAFSVDLGEAQLRGRVDRIERDSHGRLVVVDYKTGKSKPRADELARHPQLAAYQLAVERGGFGEARSGGALLVQLGASGSSEQWQTPLAESDEPDWIEAKVADVADVLHGVDFSATSGPDCRHCALRKCCPLQPEGRQVTQ